MNKEFIKKMREYFKDIPEDMIDQGEDEYHKDCPSCFGAHIAHMILNEDNYMAGKDMFFRNIGLNQAVAILLLNKAGVGHNNPFGANDWDNHPREVLGNLLTIDKPDDLIDANLSGANLEGANLQGANFRGAYLRDVDLEGANLEDANLRGAYLRGADLRKANLKKANLRGAYLRGADLRKANLKKANLESADLTGAYLTGADFRNANLEGTDLEGVTKGGEDE